MATPAVSTVQEPPREKTEAEKLAERQRRIEAKLRKAMAKQRKKLEEQQAMSDAFKRTQRYLGLRPTIAGVPPAIDDSVPVKLPFDKHVVFVCIDVEAYEKAHNKITEIGVATLDTLHLIGEAPGADGENWRSKIQARHFRIDEHKHLRNNEFVHDCPDRFEYGESEFVRLAEAAAMTAACFNYPFCGQPEPGALAPFINVERKIVFVGHNVKNDVDYLKKVGFNVSELPDLVDTIDSADLYRLWTRAPQTTSLGKILQDFDIVGWNLHNAGNDAVYTLQSMLAVCVRESSLRTTAEPMNTPPPAQPPAQHAQQEDDDDDFEI